MKNRKTSFILAWLLLTTVQLAQAQQVSDISTQAVSNSPSIVVVVGAVSSPAQFELRRNVRLTELLPCVGGLSQDA